MIAINAGCSVLCDAFAGIRPASDRLPGYVVIDGVCTAYPEVQIHLSPMACYWMGNVMTGFE